MITNDLQNRIHFGDREAFLAVYKEYGRGVYAAARKALPSDSLAQAAVKQTFLTLHEEILSGTEDFDIPVRIRELAEREIHLMRTLDRAQGAAAAAQGDPEDAPADAGELSARGAFAEDEAVLPQLPQLERERARNKRHKTKAQPVVKQSVEQPPSAPEAYAQKKKSDIFWKILLVLIDIFLIWIFAGILMALGYLPAVDLGYTWVHRIFSAITVRFS